MKKKVCSHMLASPKLNDAIAEVRDFKIDKNGGMSMLLIPKKGKKRLLKRMLLSEFMLESGFIFTEKIKDGKINLKTSAID